MNTQGFKWRRFNRLWLAETYETPLLVQIVIMLPQGFSQVNGPGGLV